MISPGFIFRTGFIVCIVAVLSCNRTAEHVERAQVPAGPGIVCGQINFIGAIPPSKKIEGKCCSDSISISDESLVVNDNATVKNVIVFIKAGPNVNVGPLHDRVLTQQNCQYIPHVLALQAGQTLDVTSHDPTLHNVHIECEQNASQNFSETEGASHSISFPNPELVRFKCDVHPWMTAYAYIFDHPFFAVTGSDGRFEIGHLPAGTYTLAIWQEKLEPQEKQFTVDAGKPVVVNFEYHGD